MKGTAKGKTKTKQIRKQQEASSKSFFHRTNDFFGQNRKIFLVLSMVASTLMCILLFDVKVSLSGDDSEYLINAGDFWRDFRFPGAFGALYPIVISPIVGLFGYQFIVLKSISCFFLLGGIYYLLQLKIMQKSLFIYPVVVIILCVRTFSSTQKRAGRNIPLLQENLLGDQLYGLTPDVINFINGSKWAAANLEKDVVIVSRKPSISKVYTGRDFAWAPSYKYPNRFRLLHSEGKKNLVML